MRLLLSFLVLLISACSVPQHHPVARALPSEIALPSATPEPGLDYLAGAKYPEVISAEHPTGWNAGFFLRTFGDAIPVIRQVAASGKAPRIRVHIIWEDDHVYVASRHDPLILSGIRLLNKVKQDFPLIDIQVSPFCEHNIRGAALDRLFNKVAKEAVGLTLVNAPYKGDKIAGILNEVHGKVAALDPPYSFSFDGTPAEHSDVVAYRTKHKSAQSFYYWSPRFNLRWSENDDTPREQRTGIPTRRFIRSIVFLHTERGATSVPRGYIIKSHSERHGLTDTRGDKLLIIAPINAQAIVLKSIAGDVLVSLQNRGSYTKGGWRYYSTSWGYEIANKAKRLTGSPLVDMFINGKKVGTINPGFRGGVFR